MALLQIVLARLLCCDEKRMISQVCECCELAHHIVHLSTTAKLVRALHFFQGIQMVRHSVAILPSTWRRCLRLSDSRARSLQMDDGTP